MTKKRVVVEVNIEWDETEDDQSLIYRQQRLRNMPQLSANNFALRNFRENTTTQILVYGFIFHPYNWQIES